MQNQKKIQNKGGTMRLGAFDCELKKDSIAIECYKTKKISERHRHRFEFNNKFKNLLASKGMIATGINKKRNLVEIVELTSHPWFLGVQFHPEYKSTVTNPHPLFSGFIKACLKRKKNERK